MILMPKRVKKTVTRTRTIKPAHYKHVDTGKVRIEKIKDKGGKTEDVEIPVMERVLVDAEKKEITEDVEIWEVVTSVNGLEEVHEFANEEDAKRFCKDTRKGS